MARHKLPQEVLELRGTAQKCRKRPKAPAIVKISTVDVEEIAQNAELLQTEYARGVFIDRCNYLNGLGMLDASYIDDLISYAKMCEIRRDALLSIEREGKYSPRYDLNGVQVGFILNPNFSILFRLMPHLSQLGAKYGLTPIDRLKFPERKEEKSLAEQLQEALK